jgi:hypothetical protein
MSIRIHPSKSTELSSASIISRSLLAHIFAAIFEEKVHPELPLEIEVYQEGPNNEEVDTY